MSVANRYPLVETRVSIRGREFTVARVADQDTLIARVETDDDLENFPYGLMLWSSAIGLSEWLIDNASRIRGRRVLEIGAGVGLCGIVAASVGARVTQTDYLPDALALCRENAARNGVENIEFVLGDWRDWPADLTGFDLAIGADILYERSLHGALLALLPRLAPEFVCADPIRPQAADFLARAKALGWSVETYPLSVDWPEDSRTIHLHRFTFGPSNGHP